MGFFNKKKEEKKTNLKQGAKVGINKDDLFNIAGGQNIANEAQAKEILDATKAVGRK